MLSCCGDFVSQIYPPFPTPAGGKSDFPKALSATRYIPLKVNFRITSAKNNEAHLTDQQYI